jgi:hypothetical protein
MASLETDDPSMKTLPVRDSGKPHDFTKTSNDPAKLYELVSSSIFWALMIMKGVTAPQHKRIRNWLSSPDSKIFYCSSSDISTVCIVGDKCPIPLVDWGDNSIPKTQMGTLPLSDYYFSAGDQSEQVLSRNSFADYIFGKFLHTAVCMFYETSSQTDAILEIEVEWTDEFEDSDLRLAKLSVAIFTIAKQMRLSIPDHFKTICTMFSQNHKLLGKSMKTWVDRQTHPQ